MSIAFLYLLTTEAFAPNLQLI